jgi:cytoskeletal protein RodZ
VYRSSEKILTLASGVNLLIFTIPLAQEYYEEMFGPDTSDDDDTSSSDSDSSDDEKKKKKNSKSKDDTTKAGDSAALMNTTKAKANAEKEMVAIVGSGTNGYNTIKQQAEEEEAPAKDVENAMTSSSKPENSKEEKLKKKKKSKKAFDRTPGTLFFVAFLGSLDDLTMFVPMLVGKALTLVELGTFLFLFIYS